jgi:hypothetical protein
MITFSEEEKLNILMKAKPFFSVVTDLELLTENNKCDIDEKNSKKVSKCYCKLNRGKLFNGERCKYCGTETVYNILFKNSDIKMIKNLEEKDVYISYKLSGIKNNNKLDNFYYVCKNPEEDYGLLILKLSIVAKVNNDNSIEENLKIEKIIYANSNKKSYAVKISRDNETEMDLFDAFNLNSKTVENDVKIIWQDANGMIDFLLKNQDLCKRFGVLECFNNTNLKMPRNAFFMFYMYLYCKYPALELLVKMDSIKLVCDIMEELSTGYNKENIREKSKELDKLINQNVTKGTMALRIPKYISDYLSLKEAEIDEFLNWCDMYEMENFSKEQFQEIITDDFYHEVCNRWYVDKILNIMRYGYTYKKLANYIDKQSGNDPSEYCHYLNLLDDYRNMMNIMEIEAEEYPGNLKSVHDNAVKAYQANKNKINDQALKQIANKLEKVKEIENDKYLIIIPESVSDFVNEGNRQHNCVSSYVRKVIDKKCIIFFIRKKDEPDESFVTAEFSCNKLYQIMYKNNVRVWDDEILNFANTFCNKIKGMHLIN